MQVFRSIAIAFSMFSALPAPRVDWEKANMRYALAFLPLVGCVIGAAEYGFWLLCGALSFGTLFRAIGFTLLPTLLSGGVHMDGFLDVSDALMSHAPAETKRAILKDPRCGAGAILACAVYYLSYTALVHALMDTPGALLPLCLVPVLSRAAAALLSLLAPESEASRGLLHTFRGAADARRAVLLLCAWAILALAAQAFLSAVFLPALLLGTALPALLAARTAKRQFGGMSGDLAGYAVQLSELGALLGVVLTERAVALL